MSCQDCIIVGYNEVPFEQYVSLLGNYSEESEAYRDLKFSFIDYQGKPYNYVDVLNSIFKPDTVAHTPQALERFACGEIPNLAAAYLTFFLRRRGQRAKYINSFQQEKDKFAAFLKDDPALVAVTTTFYVLNFPANEIVQFVRQHNSRTKIVVGGPLIANHLRNLSEDELKIMLADIGADFYVIDSQGERTLLDLVQCVKEGGSPATVPNLLYFEGAELQRTAVIPESNSMDEVDIDWHSLSADESLGQTIQMRTARSCAFKCAFCNYPTRAGKLALASVETVARELKSIRAIGNVRNVVFIDDTFNVPLPRFKDLCRMMIKQKFGFNWFSYFRCSNSDQEALDLMAESGCKGVFLGIESGSPTILKNMNKAATVERYAEGIAGLRDRGITTFGSFIVGFPGETEDTVEETTSFICDNKPDFYRAQMWYCEPGTPIHREREKYGISGQGFIWQHDTMRSLEAMDHIDRMFLRIKESLWLPQWSFDFWFIPYFLGKGFSIDQFKQFVGFADRLLALDIAYVPNHEKKRAQETSFQEMRKAASSWHVNQIGAAKAAGLPAS